MTEYIIIVIIVAIAVLLAVRHFSGSLDEKFSGAKEEISSLKGGAGVEPAVNDDTHAGESDPSHSGGNSSSGSGGSPQQTAQGDKGGSASVAAGHELDALRAPAVGDDPLNGMPQISWGQVFQIGGLIILLGVMVVVIGFKKAKGGKKTKKKKKKSKFSQSGQAMIEFTFISITLLFTILGVIQLAMILNAYALTRYAAYNAARAAIVHGGDPEKMKDAARLSLVSIFPSHGRADTVLGLTENYLAAKATDDDPSYYSYTVRINGADVNRTSAITTVSIVDNRGVNSGDVVTFDDPAQAPKGLITVQVTHQYQMVIPLVNRILFFVYNRYLSQKESGSGGYDGESLMNLSSVTDKLRRNGGLTGELPVSAYGGLYDAAAVRLRETVTVVFLCILLALPIGVVIGLVFHFTTLRRLAKRFGIETKSIFEIERKLVRTLHDRGRAYKAAVGMEIEGGVALRDLGGALQRLVTLAGEELRAKSVELCLFDSESGLTAQSFVVGAPTNAFSKGALSDDELERSAAVMKEERDGIRLVIRPLRIARKTLGVLQFEFPSERKLSAADEEIIGLYARRVGVALLDSQFTEELLRMRRLSEESIQAKTGFLANLSHELRGPLGIILNGSELALDGLCGPLTKQLEETLGMIRGNGQHLLELVNDVLDYAKVEAGKITTKPIEMPLLPLLEDILRVARGQAEQKKHKLVFEPCDETLGIVCDRRHARQMLINFLTNAIKYTPDQGTITVSVALYAGNRVKISIKDTGVGIPVEQRSKVFGAFERVENSYSEKQAGTGLGMPLTKRLAEANGGMVDFDSIPGEGSTFWLILPATRVSRYEAKKSADGTVERAKLGRGESVIVLDSEPQSRQILARYLVDQGYEVRELAAPKEIIKVFREQEIDLAIIDSGIEGMTAEEMVLAIRAHPKGANIPLMLTTPSAFTFDVENYLKLGVDRCLSKPVDLVECANAVRGLIDEYHPKALLRR